VLHADHDYSLKHESFSFFTCCLWTEKNVSKNASIFGEDRKKNGGGVCFPSSALSSLLDMGFREGGITTQPFFQPFSLSFLFLSYFFSPFSLSFFFSPFSPFPVERSFFLLRKPQVHLEHQHGISNSASDCDCTMPCDQRHGPTGIKIDSIKIASRWDRYRIRMCCSHRLASFPFLRMRFSDSMTFLRFLLSSRRRHRSLRLHQRTSLSYSCSLLFEHTGKGTNTTTS